MVYVFAILFLISIVCLIVGLIQPKVFSKIFKKNSNKIIIGLVFGFLSFAFFVAIGATAPATETKPAAPTAAANPSEATATATPTPVPTSTPATSTPTPTPDPNAIIKLSVQKAVDGLKSKGDKVSLAKVDVTKQDPEFCTGLGVDVVFDSKDSGFNNSQTIKLFYTPEIADIYLAIHKSGQTICRASVYITTDLIDKYGNKSNGTVYQTIIQNDKWSKINWNNDDDRLTYSILPGIWDVTLNLLNK